MSAETIAGTVRYVGDSDHEPTELDPVAMWVLMHGELGNHEGREASCEHRGHTFYGALHEFVGPNNGDEFWFKVFADDTEDEELDDAVSEAFRPGDQVILRPYTGCTP